MATDLCPACKKYIYHTRHEAITARLQIAQRLRMRGSTSGHQAPRGEYECPDYPRTWHLSGRPQARGRRS